MIEIKLQPKQELFNSSPADIAIMGGAAGGGKTFSLMMEPLRYIKTVLGFGAVIFRRSYPEITNLGGLWDEANIWYGYFGAKPNITRLDFAFDPHGNKIRFSHLQYEQTALEWKGAQVPLIEFDQLETFEESQFFYLLSRNRSTCGVRPYVRATANPEPNWLADFLDWWIADDGYADMSRAGKIRWFVRKDDKILWGDTPADVYQKYKLDETQHRAKSVTFIPSTIYDNQILMNKDPDYLANLMAQTEIDRARLLGDRIRGGNWHIKASAGNVFNKDWFEVVNEVPNGGVTVRYWDFAATEKKYTKKMKKSNDPDYTASVLMRKIGNTYFILDVTAEQLAPKDVDNEFMRVTLEDELRCREQGSLYSCRWELEPGSASIRESRRLTSMLSHVDASSVRKTGDKLTEWKPLSAQSRAGNVKLLEAGWNDTWLYHMHGQPDLAHDDIADASAGAYNELSVPKGIDLLWLNNQPVEIEEENYVG